MNDNKSIFVIIPCFNEARVIRQTVQEVIAAGYNVVVVDDCSTDDSYELIRGLQIDLIRHKVNLGQGAALQTGIEVAKKKGAEYFVSFDADGQHDVNDIEAIVEKLKKENLDIVLGSRFLPGAESNIKPGRKFFLKIACLMNFAFTGILLSDAHNGIRVFNKNAAEKINIKENRMAHASEFLMQIKKHRLKFAEHPVHIHYTAYSKKKGQSLFNSVKIFFELVLNKLFD